MAIDGERRAGGLAGWRAGGHRLADRAVEPLADHVDASGAPLLGGVAAGQITRAVLARGA
ncbi:hypothetical protein OG508_02095 [Streptomyces sp. NBC_01108]|uniref:hypothetical protein n=1 Tax=Streptomyces sp. NBC_01108 TaxID=2903751 RepID=UPI0038733F8A|nr:hypothetical protein OG508_02095 [Streptomyces sp. NBC_01108]